MATQPIEITGEIKGVAKLSDGRFRFKISDGLRVTPLHEYHFLLSKEKALKIANQDYEFPLGISLTVMGRLGGAGVLRSTIQYARIVSVDGHDVQSWAERNQSPTVTPDVLKGAKKTIDEAEEEAMRRRAPPEPAPLFKTPAEAYEKAMYLLRRQAKLKDPKLSKSDIWAIRDALNMLKESAGL